ncbi:M4 family metallopeptidase [Streptomyces sp. NBC_00178]|uniref:M4 family metallopeptidase n=1 Tax=Streptomyces sp. NBC_00178 TaxID=2975672 RepID=UPI002E29C524|nr:M4 family metallopeptidase [Streptomyces sp. NBC_00178]
MRPSPRTSVAGALIAGATVLAITASSGSATAGAPQAHASAVRIQPRAGALPVRLSASEQARLLGVAQKGRAATARALRLGAEEQLVPMSVLKDSDGSVHTRYERTFAGLPVLGGDLVVHTAADGTPKGADKATEARISVPSTTPARSAASAKTFAIGRARAEGAAHPTVTSTRRVVWAASGDPVLAWESVVGGLQEDGTPSRLHVISDGRTGGKLFEYQEIKTGAGNSEYSGTVDLRTTLTGSAYSMTDDTRGGHSTYDLEHGTSGTGTLFTNSTDIWGDGTPSNAETAGVDAAYGAQVTWDFYKNALGRNGIRNDGAAAYSRTHFGVAYANAFWDDGCFCMTYGDGDGDKHPLTSLDIAGHEMSHGLTAATAGLMYSGESGGLNEATSDIFGTSVEFSADNASDAGDYLIGEKVDLYGDGSPLRSMDKPSRDGLSPDNWSPGLGNLDVHYSSGPANHFFYLLSEGSGAKVINGVSYNSPTADGVAVPGIGRENATRLWYKALSERFTSTTDYADARAKTLQAAAELWGAGSATYNTVAKTWAAIGVVARVTVSKPADQNTIVKTPVNLQVQAGTNNPGALTYSATGLPAGLSINATTGLISGTPTTIGLSSVTVKVQDSSKVAGSATFGWGITAVGGNVFTNTTDVPVPDAGAAVYSAIKVSGRAGAAPSTLSVGVDIVHPYRGDVIVDLVAPDGSIYHLKKSNGFDSAADVIAAYTVNASSETAGGTWKLKVQDAYHKDSGHINSWKLTF